MLISYKQDDLLDKFNRKFNESQESDVDKENQSGTQNRMETRTSMQSMPKKGGRSGNIFQNAKESVLARGPSQVVSLR